MFIKALIIFSFLIILAFIPIPLRISLEVKNKKVHIKLFNKSINLHKEKKQSLPKGIKSNKIKYFNLLNRYKSSNFKSNIFIDTYIEYGCNDASLTAISYGTLNSFFYILYPLLQNIFKIKHYNFKIVPNFNKNILHLKTKCIIYINMAQVISILFMYRKSIKEVKAKE
ncbi:Protein of uncharacterised function (DUF2953) [Clostridium putrefaciens]|uniref:Protein of uncharacterized function (DUF2953) n=1 Tax=Clostridium putrefaciens TaxID=99675 RepID=A0A381J7S2_9CLOT|nr:DUF2953 domain-containing protein [Clostridium putrefaciens]SUY47165.1 Protein of uncharacterised function (DUF2953) [Clostridium putrefaciens]